ncbi:MAG: hypothetical protein ACFFAN_10985 [Promethearchaeota archaeon]
MQIEIFGGINEIGGNKIFINVGNRKFLFDFGLSFNDNNKYFSEFLSPRRFNGIIDYLYLGLIPPINNLYRNDLITPFQEVLKKESYKITHSTENIVDAFFLSHPHMDHYKFIGFLRKDTPIYMNWISHTLIDFLSKTSNDPLLSEILEFHEYFKMVPKKRQKKNGEIEYKRASKNDYNEIETKRKIKIMKPKKPYSFKSSVGEVNISQYLTDHSVPGACSFIIENDGRSIVYTGDFRRHGVHREWVDKFLEVAHNSNPIAIITEGTRVTNIEDFNNGSYRIDDQTEQDVKIRSKDMIRRHNGLILVNIPSRDLDRILLYYKLAKRFNRVFAVTPKIFLLLDSFKACLDNMEEIVVKRFYEAYSLPEFTDESLVIYMPRKGWGKFELFDYKTYQKEIFKHYNFLTYKDIQKEPEKYLLYLDFFMLGELIDLDQKPDTIIYLNSTTDPFNEEMVLQEEKLNAWLERFGILKTETIHSSGHCSVDDLIEALEKIDADNIIPIHTEHPKTFEEFGLRGKIIMPEMGKKYVF